MDKNDMSNTVDAVRNYANNASESEKNQKYGQQKWGLFETNYQRNKGITTDESLQEIEVNFPFRLIYIYILCLR